MNERANRPTEPEGPTGRVATWASGLRLDDVPARVRERARTLLLDGVGCALVGAHLPWSETAVDAVTALEAAGTSPIIGWGRTTSAPAAALLNSTFVQGFELDDFHPLAPLHSASLLLPALLAAPVAPPTGRELLTATIAGLEIGPRVGLALHGAEMLSRGWHSGPVFGTIATAVAVGRLLGLDPDAMEDAIGHGATRSAGLMSAQFGAMSKRMQHGYASRDGLYAAMLARGGYTGIKASLETPFGGWLSTFGEGHEPDASQVTRALGERWETERIAIKPHAAMGGLHAPVDAVMELAAERPLVPDEIEAIDVDLSHAVYHHGWWPPTRPLTPTGAQMNVAYAVAVTALDGACLVRQFAPDRLDADDVWRLVGKVTAHHEPSFDATPEGRGQTRVRIRFTDGQELSTHLQASRALMRPLTSDAARAKFRSLTEGILTADRQRRIEALVDGLEELDDIAPLIGELAAPVGGVFADGD